MYICCMHVFTNVVPSFLPLFILVNLFCHMGLHRVLDSYIVTWLYDIVPFNKMLAFTINALFEQNLQLGYHFGQKTELRSLMCWCTILWGDDGISIISASYFSQCRNSLCIDRVLTGFYACCKIAPQNMPLVGDNFSIDDDLSIFINIPCFVRLDHW